MVSIRQQFGVVADAVGVLVSTPQLLVYPVVTALLGLAFPLAFGGLAFALGGQIGGIVALVGIFVGFPVAFAFLMVAYCYELNEVFEGRRPSPGAGLGRAAGRIKLVVVAAVVLGVGGFAAQALDGQIPFGDAIGVASSWGFRVAGVFVFPVIATTQLGLRDGMSEVLAAVESQWGKSIVATVSTRAVGMVIAWTGILGGIGLAVAAFTGRFAVELPPIGPFTLPVLVAVGGIVLAVTVQFTVDGLLRTALYRYARDGELPPALSSDPERIVETDGPQSSGRGQSATGH